jgi:hypothetical protein
MAPSPSHEKATLATSGERRKDDAQAMRIAELEAKIQRKNEVVAELLEEHVKLKKACGEP